MFGARNEPNNFTFRSTTTTQVDRKKKMEKTLTDRTKTEAKNPEWISMNEYIWLCPNTTVGSTLWARVWMWFSVCTSHRAYFEAFRVLVSKILFHFSWLAAEHWTNLLAFFFFFVSSVFLCLLLPFESFLLGMMCVRSGELSRVHAMSVSRNGCNGLTEWKIVNAHTICSAFCASTMWLRAGNKKNNIESSSAQRLIAALCVHIFSFSSPSAKKQLN